MPRTPFPHILTEPKLSNDFTFRFVTTAKIIEGEIVCEHSHVQENLKSKEFEPVMNCYVVKEIIEERPARGDWSAYDEHPFYYHTKGEYLHQAFISTLHESVK